MACRALPALSPRQAWKVAVERSELHLVWPAPLFAAEAHVLLRTGADDDSLGGLLSEAFHGDRGQRLLEQTAAAHPQPSLDPFGDSPWSGVAATVSQMAYPRRMTAQLVEELARTAGRLPRHEPRPLYRQRHQAAGVLLLSVTQCKDGFAALIAELAVLGYFEDAFGSECDDSHDDPAEQGQRALAERLELDAVRLWPLHSWQDGTLGQSGVHQNWPDEVFFEVVEALDERVARPRQRRWHSFHQGWDYSDYSRPAGQAVYRWRVNELIGRSQVPLNLAKSGDDAGLLVHASGDPRDQLTDSALQTEDFRDRMEVQHAVALYRARVVSREQKRSAIVTLGRVLEQRRPLVETSLTKKDAGALFQIANEFDLRHRRAVTHGKAQRDDYDEAFLDWVYWWYLATVELTNQLLREPTAEPVAPHD